MDERKVEYLKGKIENKEKDLDKYRIIADALAYNPESHIDSLKRIPNEIKLAKINDKKYLIDLDYLPLKKYGRAKFGEPTWGEPDVIDVTGLGEEEITELARQKCRDKQKRFILVEKMYLNTKMNYDQEKDLSVYDANILGDDGQVKTVDNFYKNANRMYVVKTANSRVALYECDGKYYVSERRLILTKDAYGCIVTSGYSRKDEIFDEVTLEQINEIFGKKDIANEKYGENLDEAIDGKKYVYTHFFEPECQNLYEKDKRVDKEVTSDEIAGVSKDMQMTTSDINENLLKRLWKKLKEKIQGRN